MPDSPRPKSNLGLVLEAVGKYDEAVESYEQALKLAPDNVEVIGNLARLLVRTGRKGDRTRELLGQVVMKDPRPEWTEWARERLALMGKREMDVGVPGGSE